MSVAQLWWVFFAVSTVVYVLVIGALVLAIRHARRSETSGELRPADRRRLMVGSAMAATVVVLLCLLASDFVMGHRLFARRDDPDALHLKVTAHQFWWQLEYEDADPSRRLITANEIHVPVGRRIEVSLQTQDVIHSFWLPNIAGKKDLIPGITNNASFIVERPGRYEGQCAEYCGYQHAQMRTVLRAVSPEEFERWKSAQLQPAVQPTTVEQRGGQAVFMSASCALCHSIQGTNAGGTTGPDLTHLASRDMIAAGALRNTPRNLARWIRNPQQLKPGVNMPATALTPKDLDALVSYLSSLR